MSPGSIFGRLSRRGAPDVYDERGYIFTGVGFTSLPIQTHPDDNYVRTPGSQTYDRAWQGWQKENAASLLVYGSRKPGWGPMVPGTQPSESPYAANTMQWLDEANRAGGIGRVLKSPAASYGAIGPGLPWVPNPTEPPAGGSAYASRPPGIVRTILSRLGMG